MTACAEKGCAGTIENGCCNICGARAPEPARPARAARSALSQPTQLSTWSGPSFRARSSSDRSSRGRLGAGLVEIPPVPARDPFSAVLANPEVAENKRFCSACGRPVGRSRGGVPGRMEGFCGDCGAPFSFTPKLERGELVGGQYEVIGCLAHGGLGWVYLAVDHNLANRWVVLKGLLDAGDAGAQVAAIAERRFLAEVQHPNIVGVHNFVQHKDRRTGTVAGYIVLEYVGGKSLRQLVLERPEEGSLPLAQALAYAIEALPALGYLHGLGLVYCDFKPENVLQTEEQLKLIDMGAVRRIDDPNCPVYGTAGYQAPEIATQGPSPSSDLYTVARTLAVLTFPFSGFTTRYAYGLPDPAEVPLLAQQESFRRLLLRATDRAPARRFTSADEMAAQLTGVLREVLATGDGHPRPAFSTLFSPELRAIGMQAAGGLGGAVLHGPPPAADITAGLPAPLADPADPAASYLATLNVLDQEQQAAALSAAVAGDQVVPANVAESALLRLALARARIASGDVTGAAALLDELGGQEGTDWRVTWYRGLLALARDRPDDACTAFSAVYDHLPGELAPKLALALATEAAGDRAAAERYFQVVWSVDRAYVSAAFGRARCRFAAGDRAGATNVLTAVPDTSRYHVAAQIAAVQALVAGRDPHGLTAAELTQAASRLARLQLDTARHESLVVEILTAALGWVAGAASAAAHGGRLLDCELTERGLRFGLERSYRSLARLARDKSRRIEFVDKANEVRPRTWS